MKINTRFIVVLVCCAGFLTAGILLQHFIQNDQEVIAHKVTANLEAEIKRTNESVALIETYLAAGLTPWYPAETDFYFYKYRKGILTGWSDNQVIPIDSDTARYRHFRSGKSDFLLCRYTLRNGENLLVAIPLIRQYSISNQYLKPTWNKRIFPMDQIQVFDSEESQGLEITIGSKKLFRIVPELQPNLYSRDKSGFLILFTIIILVGCYWILFKLIERIPSKMLGFGLMLAAVVLTRLLMTTTGWPATFIKTWFFDPQIYASSGLNGSLGDLFLNLLSLLFPVVFLLRWYSRFNLLHTRGVWLAIPSTFLFLIVFALPYRVIQSIYHNSTLQLDVAHLSTIDSMELLALICVFLSGVIAFISGHVFIRLAIKNLNPGPTILAVSAGYLLYIVNCEYNNQPYIFIVLLSVVLWIFIQVLGLIKSLRLQGFSVFTYLFLVVFVQAVLCTAGIDVFSTEKKLESQFRFAMNYLDRDYFGEYLLHETGQKIATDKFIQSRLITPFLGRESVKQKIRQVYLSRYFDKYEIEILLFNSTGEPIGSGPAGFKSVIENYNRNATGTTYSDVYYIETPMGDITQKYLLVIPVKWNRAIAGFIVVDLSLKRLIPDFVYPELLLDNRFRQSSGEEDFSYVVIGQGKVLSSAGNVNYEPILKPHWLGNPDLYTKGLKDKDSWHIAVEDINGRISIVSSARTPISRFIGTFSMLLVFGLFLILLFILVQSFLRYRSGKRLNLAERIQVMLNLAFFIPLLLVSIVTLSVTNAGSKAQLTKEFQLRARNFADELSAAIRIERLEGESGSVRSLENALNEFSRLTRLDVNLYDSTGQLTSTTQPLIYEGNLFSDRINESALTRIRKNDRVFVIDETVGTLKFSTAYAKLSDPASGELFGIVGIPFFQSASSLQKQQSEILTNILIIFVLIFMVLLALSYSISKWLTFPLVFITQSLRKISITGMNRPLGWKSDDEIGLLAKEYNQLVFKLTESLAALERTQRERAWREIAQQVAHEIKNPLTPMKLTLQQLERGLQDESSDPSKVLRAVKSILSQVDTLNEIASSFSAFAKLPEPVLKEVALDKLIRNVITLHQHAGDIQFQSGAGPFITPIDEALMSRILSNLILNAFQAAIPGTALVVTIRLERSQDQLKLQIQDNGKGMTAVVAERVFLPHFTTKETGSGLGLAISKQAIEQMKGSIQFETVPMEGTTFTIWLPVWKG